MNSGRLFRFEGYAQVSFFYRCACSLISRLLTLLILALQLVLLFGCSKGRLLVLNSIISLGAI